MYLHIFLYVYTYTEMQRGICLSAIGVFFIFCVATVVADRAIREVRRKYIYTSIHIERYVYTYISIRLYI